MMNEMIIESINTGHPRMEVFQDGEVYTGICKKPVSGPVHLKTLGFEGDGIADAKHHGGYDKAVCVYAVNHYPYWEKALGIKLSFAAFGENLSVSNLHEDDVCVGDIFKIGNAIVQISQPRQPCKTLAARYGRSDLVKMVVDTGLTGFYLKVLREGIVDSKDELALMERDPNNITISFANRIFHHDKKNREGIDKVLAVSALSESWQKSYKKLRQKII